MIEEHYPPREKTDTDESWDNDWGAYDTANPDMFRTEPNDSTIEPLLEAFARALCEMPVLEDAELFTYVVFERDENDEDRAGLPTRERETDLSHRFRDV